MATVTHRVASTDTLDVTSYASTAFTPAAGEFLVVFVAASATVAATPTLTASANGITFTRLSTQAVKNTSLDTEYVFVADQLVGASPASMTVTFDCTGDAATGAFIVVEGYAGMSKVGAAAVRQAAKQDNQAGATTPAPVFAQATLSDNPTVAVVFDTSATGITPPTGWTEQADVTRATPTAGCEVVTRDSGFAGTTITWGSTSTAFCVIALELDASGVGGYVERPKFFAPRRAPSLFRFVQPTGVVVGNGLTPVTPLTVSTSWNVRAPVVKTVASTWNTRASVTPKAVATSWNVRSVVTALAVATTWRVRAAVVKTVATTWNGRAAVTRAVGTSWNVRGAVSPKTIATTWNTRGAVSPKTISTTWRVRSAVSKTTATTWNVRAAVARTVATTWNVRSVVAAKTVSTTWRVRSAVVKTIATTWNVLASLTPVTPLTIATTWRVRVQVSKTTATSWNVRQAVARTVGTAWNVHTIVAPKTVATTWRVRSQTSRTITTSWNTRARVAPKTVVTTWNVLAGTQFDITVTGVVVRGHSGYLMTRSTGSLGQRPHAGHVAASNTGTTQREHEGTVIP